MEFEELELMATEDDFAMEGPDSPSRDSTTAEKDLHDTPEKQYEEMDAEEFSPDVNTHKSGEDRSVDSEMEEKLRRRRERFGTDSTSNYNKSTRSKPECHSSNKNSGKRNRGRSSHTTHFNKARLLKPLYETRHLSPEILGREIAYRLEEKKTLVIKNVVKVLGHNNAMDLLEETVKIQKGRGMKTADGKRRRSSGGIYLYLLKQRANKEEWDEIFKEDKVINKQKEKIKKEKAKQERIQQMKKELINQVDKIYNVEKDDCSENIDLSGKDHTETVVSKNDE